MNRLLRTALVLGAAAALVAGCGGTTKGSDAAKGDGGAAGERQADPNAKIKEGLQISRPSLLASVLGG